MKVKFTYIALVAMNLVTLYFATTYISAEYLFDTSNGGELQQSTQFSGFWIMANAIANFGLLVVLLTTVFKSRDA
jgi:hypothetical protein